MDEPLRPAVLKAFLAEVLENDTLEVSEHAIRRLRERSLDIVDVVNVLRCGVADEGEHENGSWRYKVKTRRICVVVACWEGSQEDKFATIVTAWRLDA